MKKTKSITKNNVRDTISNIFSRVLYKTTFSTRKGNQVILSLDLLKEDVQNELLVITTLRLEKIYTNLLKQPDCTTIMRKKGKLIFFQFIKTSCEEFLTKKYGYKITINPQTLKQALYTKNLLRDVDILFKIPFYSLLNPTDPNFRLIYYPIYSFASENFLEALIDNLVVETSNCIAYYSLLNLSSVYAFRQLIYRSKFLSLRNFERFKNNLNWQLRVKTFIDRPIELYTSKYKVYILRTSGLYSKTLYANRSKELDSLSKIPLTTIVFIEIGDFISSRIDETIYVLGKGVRFTFTNVLGQVIGLTWRGVIEGLKK